MGLRDVVAYISNSHITATLAIRPHERAGESAKKIVHDYGVCGDSLTAIRHRIPSTVLPRCYAGAFTFRVKEYVNGALWVCPSAAALVALAVGFAMSQVTVVPRFDPGSLRPSREPPTMPVHCSSPSAQS